MRTVRRQVRELNAGKHEQLAALMRAYAAEKQHWLAVFARRDHRALVKRHRQVRDDAVARQYEPVSGLQARMWKLALIDAAETWDKYWQALFVEVRRKIGSRSDFDEPMRHYAFWILSGYAQFFSCLEGEAPSPRFDLAPEPLRRVANAVRRQVARLRGKKPSVRRARSVVLDANCYTAFEESGVQYLKIMTLERGRRVALPLSGKTAISGNIRVVQAGERVEVHVSQALAPKTRESGVIAAADFGYTEAMTDTEGNAYGENLGDIITRASDERHQKGRSRNKLRALAEKYEASRSPRLRAKARHIRRYNLGKKKWRRREDKTRASIECEINRGLNALIREQDPSVLVTEDVRHAFTFDKPKAWNRKLSAWARGVLQDRTEFKALAEGFRHEQVNPAYGSQTCFRCGYVDARNRNGDRFACLHCGRDHADRVAALNILDRRADREITRHTPYREVKALLLRRFHRRLEAGGGLPPPATVPGRTSDTVAGAPQRRARHAS